MINTDVIMILKFYFRFYISINVQILQFYNFFACLLYPDFDKLCNSNTLDHFGNLEIIVFTS